MTKRTAESLGVAASAKVHSSIDRNRDRWVQQLKDLSAFPGISADGFETNELRSTAEWLTALLKKAGVSGVELLREEGSAPYLMAELKSPRTSAPTVLCYAHYDVQPPGRASLWNSPAFEPTVRDGRLFGRGTADDKAGVIAITAALTSYLESGEPLPANVTLLLDGEEERGSPHLPAFLKKHASRLHADVLLVPDLVSPMLDRTCLVFSLRGLLEFRVKISALSRAIHSGLGGGVLPDVTQALTRLYGGLFDSRGRVKIPGLHNQPIPARVLKPLEKLTRKPADFALATGVPFLRNNARDFYQSLWMEPALTIVQLQVGEPGQHANRLQPELDVSFSLRTPPGVSLGPAKRFLKQYFTRNLPFGCKGEIEFVHEAEGFMMDPEDPVFRNALRFATEAYGKPAIALGAGLTIPFVRMMEQEIGKMTTLLLGVEDFLSNAHSENESVSLDMFHKSVHTVADLFGVATPSAASSR